MFSNFIRRKAWQARRPRLMQFSSKPWKSRYFKKIGRNGAAEDFFEPAGNAIWNALPPGTKARMFFRSRYFSRWKWGTLFSAGIAGAGLMYYFNPERAERLRRRQLLSGSATYNGGSRIRGGLARKLFRFRMSEDDTLADKVRSRLRQVVRNAGSIGVRAQKGRVTLGGLASSRDSEQLLRQVRGVRGVKEIDNRLESFEEQYGQGQPQREGQYSSQGQSGGQSSRSERRARRRTIAGATAGSALILAGLRQRSILSAVAGSWLVARSVKRRSFSRSGAQVPQRGIQVHKTIHINTPVARAYAAWSNFENFPAYLRHVRRVRRIEDGVRSKHPRWRWTVDGPAGTEVEFDTFVVASESDRLLAWRTDADSPIQHAGVAHFNENPDGSTTVEIHMSYDPPAGILGHAVAKLFGADPSNQMDDDLVRLKSYIESSGGRQSQQQESASARSRQGAQQSSASAHH
ncbi:MAG TPA: SRPBCC family protein [Gammaproteobacteria bacterium]|nr:SRPBCC family protein [Gammaproteobacteria bacterium]